MWKSFENIGLQTSEKVSWEKRKKKKRAQNITLTVHRTGDLKSTYKSEDEVSFVRIRRQLSVMFSWSEIIARVNTSRKQLVEHVVFVVPKVTIKQ